eukprot:TRINITY_DN5001_c1_g1_i1.p1 TRINITY_DN5001_c1_g1~~TRINITY_DN5001_c1_g1_i1.p1  ORF type:complete len:254 (+),score=84.92 TRINITY_DN5001_c1_g1_i1:74-763(+)
MHAATATASPRAVELPHSASWADDIDEAWERQLLEVSEQRDSEGSTQGVSSAGSPVRRRSSLDSMDAHSTPHGRSSPWLDASPSRTEPGAGRTFTTPSYQSQWRRRDATPTSGGRGCSDDASACRTPFPSAPPPAYMPAYEHPVEQEYRVDGVHQYPVYVLPFAFAPLPEVGAYVPGQHVEVLRTDGTWTPATVVRFAGDSYVVQITEAKTKTIPLRLIHKYLRPADAN